MNPAQQEMQQKANERKERITLVKRTHDIFCGIYGKEIRLVGGDNPGHTDAESFVSVPLEDDQSDLIHKHEWQHLFMGSDLRAREKFVKEYAAQIRQGAPTIHQGQLETFLHYFVNGLDDLRVNDLWKKPYPQSAEDIEKRWAHIILAYGGYQQDLIMYSMAVGLGLKVGHQLLPSKWDPYLGVIEEGLTLVYGFGGVAPMVAAKFILDRMLQGLLESFLPITAPSPLPLVPQSSEGSQRPSEGHGSKSLAPPLLNRRTTTIDQLNAQQSMSQAQTGLVDQLVGGSMKSKSLDFFKDAKKPEGVDPNFQRTVSTVKAALGAATVQQIQKVLEDSKWEVEKAIKALLGKAKTLTADQKLLKGTGKTTFRDVHPDQVELFELTPDDLFITDKLRGSFSRLMDKKRRRVSDIGSTIDMNAYVDFLTGTGDGEIFEEEWSERGFTSLILLDMSGSMSAHWDTVSRSCKVLAKAMKFPFSKFEVWGFSGNTKGQVFIHRFQDVEKGYTLKSEEAWGTTPLHVAAEVAVRRLSQRAGTAQHLFVITDGVPMAAGPSGESISPAHLMRSVAGTIRRGRKHGVNTVGLVLGESIPDAIAEMMFGTRRWMRAEDETEMFVSLVGLVQSAFVSYLRKY
jgi:hypothetical protein